MGKKIISSLIYLLTIKLCVALTLLIYYFTQISFNNTCRIYVIACLISVIFWLLSNLYFYNYTTINKYLQIFIIITELCAAYVSSGVSLIYIFIFLEIENGIFAIPTLIGCVLTLCFALTVLINSHVIYERQIEMTREKEYSYTQNFEKKYLDKNGSYSRLPIVTRSRSET